MKTGLGPEEGNKKKREEESDWSRKEMGQGENQKEKKRKVMGC
jgi:hypothetical protein